jgi:predicted anti-sigma-YlaC factor YlaD
VEPDDYQGMDCSTARETLSAAYDGEAGQLERQSLEAHLATCPGCRAFAADALALHRLVRVSPAPVVPDLTASIVAAHRPRPAERRIELAGRGVLGAVAAVLLLLGLPALASTGHHDHSSHHLAAFDVAIAVGFAWVAWRPLRALAGFLPIGTALVAACIAVTLVDGTLSLHVVSHAVSLFGLGVAWLLEARLVHAPHRSHRLLHLA